MGCVVVWWRARRRTGAGSPRAVEQKKRGARRARDNQDWRNAAKRKGEKQKRDPIRSLQGAGSRAGGGFACQKNLARLLCLPPAVLLRECVCVFSSTHPHLFLPASQPAHVWLARKEGAAAYAQVRRILQQTLPMVQVALVVAPRQVTVRSLRPAGLQ